MPRRGQANEREADASLRNAPESPRLRNRLWRSVLPPRRRAAGVCGRARGHQRRGSRGCGQAVGVDFGTGRSEAGSTPCARRHAPPRQQARRAAAGNGPRRPAAVRSASVKERSVAPDDRATVRARCRNDGRRIREPRAWSLAHRACHRGVRGGDQPPLLVPHRLRRSAGTDSGSSTGGTPGRAAVGRDDFRHVSCRPRDARAVDARPTGCGPPVTTAALAGGSRCRSR